MYEQLGDLPKAYLWAYVAGVCSESDIAKAPSQGLFALLDNDVAAKAMQSALDTPRIIIESTMRRLIKGMSLIRGIS